MPLSLAVVVVVVVGCCRWLLQLLSQLLSQLQLQLQLQLLLLLNSQPHTGPEGRRTGRAAVSTEPWSEGNACVGIANAPLLDPVVRLCWIQRPVLFGYFFDRRESSRTLGQQRKRNTASFGRTEVLAIAVAIAVADTLAPVACAVATQTPTPCPPSHRVATPRPSATPPSHARRTARAPTPPCGRRPRSPSARGAPRS